MEQSVQDLIEDLIEDLMEDVNSVAETMVDSRELICNLRHFTNEGPNNSPIYFTPAALFRSHYWAISVCIRCSSLY